MSPRCDHARLLASEPRAMQIRIMHASMIPASTRLAAILLLANLFVTMLDRMNVRVESFADSSGEMSELLT